MNKATPLLQIVLKSMIGAGAGILAGFIYGLIIWMLYVALVAITGETNSTMPAAIASFLGMGSGAIIGSIFGGLSGIKEAYKK